MYLTTTTEIIENFDFLLEPEFTPENPICRRCKSPLDQQMNYEEGEIKIVWICKKCRRSITETDGSD